MAIATYRADSDIAPSKRTFIAGNKLFFDIDFDDGKWHHLALLRSGETFTAYHNGSVLGTGSAAALSKVDLLDIGGLDRDPKCSVFIPLS